MKLYSINTILTLGKTEEKIKDSFLGLFNNMIANQFKIYDEEKKALDFDKAVEKTTKIITLGFPATIYARVNNAFIKIVIDRSHEKGDLITIIPEKESLATKKEIDGNKQALDLGFYVQLMLELTENFAIDELYTQELT